MLKRSLSLDLLRSLAALIVFLGHLFFNPSHQISDDSPMFLFGIFKLGAFSVSIFFFLSGMALHFQTKKYGHDLVWMKARVVRLMPTYWVALLVPLIGAFLVGTEISYPKHGYILSLFGIQAFTPETLIPPANPPLWSLSIELILSLGLVMLASNKLNLTTQAILVSVFLLSALLTLNAILVGLIYFYLGYLTLEIPKLRNLRLSTSVFLSTLSILFCYANWEKIVSGGVNATNLLTSITLASLICVATLNLKYIKDGLLVDISKRAYSLYAVHFPTLSFVDRFLFRDVEGLPWQQFGLDILLVVVLTEFMYRIVEVPSILRSREILERNSISRELQHR